MPFVPGTDGIPGAAEEFTAAPPCGPVSSAWRNVSMEVVRAAPRPACSAGDIQEPPGSHRPSVTVVRNFDQVAARITGGSWRAEIKRGFHPGFWRFCSSKVRPVGEAGASSTRSWGAPLGAFPGPPRAPRVQRWRRELRPRGSLLLGCEDFWGHVCTPRQACKQDRTQGKERAYQDTHSQAEVCP